MRQVLYICNICGYSMISERLKSLAFIGSLIDFCEDCKDGDIHICEGCMRKLDTFFNKGKDDVV